MAPHTTDYPVASAASAGSDSLKASVQKSLQSEWEHSPAEFDFRSDTLTTPTPSMLASLATTSLGDDMYTESTTTTALESRLAKIFNKEAALYVMSGTMGNQLAVRSHLTAPPHSVVCDARAHIMNYEAGGLALLSQAQAYPATASNGKYLTLEDIKPVVTLSTNIHYAPTKVISLENTLGGCIMPVEEMRRISTWAHENGLKVHLDGARIWNAASVVEGGAEALEERLREYADLVDSLSICFSKSLGAPVGSFIVGSTELINKARHVRKAIGGAIRQAGILTSMAAVALDEVFFAGRLKEANVYAKEIAAAWKSLGGKLLLDVESNMCWLDLDGRGVLTEEVESAAKERGLKISGGRVVTHYQNSEDSVGRLVDALREAVVTADRRNGKMEEDEA